MSGTVAKVETIDKVEGFILGVLDIEYFGTVFEFRLGEVFAKVDKDGLDGFHLTCLDFLEEGTLVVAADFDRSDRRFGDFEDGFGFAFEFVDDDVVFVLEETMGEGYEFGFGDFG